MKLSINRGYPTKGTFIIKEVSKSKEGMSMCKI